MKTLTLFLNLVRKNIIPIIIVMFTLTISLFILITLFGQYKFVIYTKSIYMESRLDNDVYFMIPQIGDFDIDQTTSQELKNEIQKYSVFSHFITYHYSLTEYNLNVVNAQYYDLNMRESFKLKVDKGRWLSANPEHTEAVIGGVVWDGVELGDEILLDNGIILEIVGIMGNEVIFPSFNSTTNDFITDSFFNVTDTIIFITEETLDQDVYNKIQANKSFNFFVVFNENASVKEKHQLISFMENRGIQRNYDEIIENTNKQIKSWIKRGFPLPIFLIIITTINIICIYAVVIRQSMIDLSKYYLLGCSKGKGIAIIILSLTSLFTIPIGLNIVNALCFPNFLRQNKVYAINYILDSGCIVPVLIYLLVIFLILIIMPIAFFYKYSPLDFYRRNI